MAKKTTTRAASIDRITLPELQNNDGALLASGQSVDAERFANVNLDGRDLTGISFGECEFLTVSLHETRLRGASFSECLASDLHAPVFSAPRSSWRDVRIDRARLGSVEAYEATLRSVHIDGSKLDFVNLRNANLTDVRFSNCVIDELDLGSATVQRFELQNCRITTLEIGGAKLKDVDLRGGDFSAIHGLEGLRGATIDEAQLSQLAPLLAAHLGIHVE